MTPSRGSPLFGRLWITREARAKSGLASGAVASASAGASLRTERVVTTLHSGSDPLSRPKPGSGDPPAAPAPDRTVDDALARLAQPVFPDRPVLALRWSGTTQVSPQLNRHARNALISGILSLFCFGPLAGIVAIVEGARAQREIAAARGYQTGEGLAMTGLALGIAVCASWLWALGLGWVFSV